MGFDRDIPIGRPARRAKTARMAAKRAQSGLEGVCGAGTVLESLRGSDGPVRASWTITLSYPPSANHLYATIYVRGRPRRFKSAEARAYTSSVGARVAIKAEPFSLRPPYRLMMALWPPDARRRDVDNTVKIVQDSLAMALEFDDRVIAEVLIARRGVDRENPRAEVTIQEADGGVD